MGNLSREATHTSMATLRKLWRWPRHVGVSNNQAHHPIDKVAAPRRLSRPAAPVVAPIVIRPDQPMTLFTKEEIGQVRGDHGPLQPLVSCPPRTLAGAQGRALMVATRGLADWRRHREETTQEGWRKHWSKNAQSVPSTIVQHERA